MSIRTMVYRKGTKLKVDGKFYDYQIVEETGDENCGLAAALEDGWLPTPTAVDAAEDEVPETPSEDAPPTREELEEKAAELGIEFQSNTRDKTLAKKIAEALEAQGD